ncbi:MAG TPA: CHASE4 domain-containing protein, partial [Chthoniobacterales bacterium]
KITLLLLAVVAVFVAGLWAFRAFDQEKFRVIRTSRLVEAKHSFEAFLEKDGEPLVTLADYDTTWDNMVQAIETRNEKWLNENVSSETLLGYKAYAAWIYDRNANLVYSRNAIPFDP